MSIDEMWDFLADYGIATDGEIELVTSINGYNEKSLNDILFVRTGYRNFDQYKEYELAEYGDE